MKYFIFFFGTVFLIASSANSQTAEQTAAFADSLFVAGNFASALKNYKRAFFFSDNQSQQRLYQKIGDCLSAEEKYLEAVDNYDKALAFSDNDSIETEISLKKSYCFIFSENYLHAQAELISIPTSKYLIQRQKINLALAVAYFGADDYVNARETFKNSVPESRSDLKHSIDSIFGNINRLKRPNPTSAALLSFIVPGGGQMLAGDFKNGANALVLSAIIATVGVKVAMLYSPADALITVAPWFLRYYKGNLRGARKSAAMRKARKKNRILNQILDVIANSK